MGVVIVGAGLSGLSCAASLGGRCSLWERGDRPGGLCRTERRGRFTVDHAGHYLHFRDGEMKRGVLRLLGSNSVFVRRSSWVYLYGKLTPYPFQANIHGHNPALIRECISGLVRVRASAKAAPARENYLEWMVRTFGTGFTRHFLAPFNRKQFRTPLEELTPLQGGRFVPRPRIEDVVRGAMTPEPPRLGYNAAFWHPRRGGIEVLARALARRVRRILRTGVALRKVHARKRVAEMSDGTRVPYGILVSTVPLPALLRMLGPDATGASGLAGALRHIGVLCVHFLVRNPREKVRHWIYVPERRIGFYRVGFPANVTPADAPPGTGIVSAEVSYLPGARPSVSRAARESLRGAVHMGLIGSARDVIATMAFDMPYAYVLFDRAYGRARADAMKLLARHGIISIGRYGGWAYGGMEDALREGRDTGRLIRAYGSRAAAFHAREVTGHG